ncbi:MAG: histidine phosphatase family protein [Gemmatimonadetes bacterium]|nr:histidine phosphatase family protein [Gemmatimonadota bacterium]MBT5142163.1 histidine phosphatase family protein [Gemmatimonadota bacterium]MBT5589252.1 histidine phosphatase family protein [Gemmatimonadota bacterium]MBT5963098.1 histidine phosphatase family protein [Gemmatimonadota bacterium]MBT7457978.1 histidine phosphatase family protein [Gemmatimonadota bacterium]
MTGEIPWPTLPAMTTTLYLIRHGETEFNTRGIYQGQADSPLTPDGEAQARALAPRIAGFDTARNLYASDLTRAYRTAEFVATPNHHQIVTDVGLRERHYGIFQGKVKKEISTQFPDVWEKYRSGDPDYAIPDGESQRQFLDRTCEVMTRIADAHEGEGVVAVSHGGTLGVFAKHVLGLEISAPRPFDIGNTSLTIVERTAGVWKIRTLGELAHLQRLPGMNQTEG